MSSATKHQRPLDRFEPRNLRHDVEGTPIVFPVLLDADGEQVGKIDGVIERRLLRKRRCGVCGDPLGETFCYVTEALPRRKRMSATAGIHEDCLYYAFGRCPFLALATYRNPEFSRRAHRKGRDLTVHYTTGYWVVWPSYWLRKLSGWFWDRVGKPEKTAIWGWPILWAKPAVKTWTPVRGRGDVAREVLP